MLQHETEKQRNPWLMGGIVFFVVLALQHMFVIDLQTMIIYSILVAGAFVIVHTILNHHVRIHNTE